MATMEEKQPKPLSSKDKIHDCYAALSTSMTKLHLAGVFLILIM